MARFKKTLPNEPEDVVTETVEQVSIEEQVPIEPKTEKEQTLSTLIAKDMSVMARKAPTMEQKHIIGNLVPDFTYVIVKKIHSVIYGDFYLLNNGSYVSTVGNFTVKE